MDEIYGEEMPPEPGEGRRVGRTLHGFREKRIEGKAGKKQKQPGQQRTEQRRDKHSTADERKHTEKKELSGMKMYVAAEMSSPAPNTVIPRFTARCPKCIQ